MVCSARRLNGHNGDSAAESQSEGLDVAVLTIRMRDVEVYLWAGASEVGGEPCWAGKPEALWANPREATRKTDGGSTRMPGGFFCGYIVGTQSWSLRTQLCRRRKPD